MADALASGASARKGVGVQVPPRARIKIPGENRGFSFVCLLLTGGVNRMKLSRVSNLHELRKTVFGPGSAAY